MVSPNKIEHRALNTLEMIIDDHTTMDHQFNGNDKEMSWDGYIWLYKGNDGNQSKKTFDGRVPVQIKGHTDTEQKYIGKEKINYSVEIDDLRAFATEKGVLYFHIFINSRERAIFYSSLYPSKVADYLALAQRSGNSTTISIPFIKLEQQPEKLYIVAKQFDDEAKKQGSAYTPLVENRIRSDEFEKLRSVNLSVVGASDTLSILRGLSSGDICLYGKTDGDRFERPLEWHDDSKFYAGREIVQSVCIDDEEYYKKYKCIADSDGGMELILSPNLRINLTEGKCHYKVVSTLKELYVDARFLLKLYKSQSFSIAQHTIKYTDPKITEDFHNRLQYIVDLYETLEMIGLDTNTRVSEYTDKQQAQFLEIVNIRLGAYNNRLPNETSKYLWHFGEKCVPILISKGKEGNELYNAVYTEKMAVFLPYEEDGIGKGYRVPLFIYQDVEVLGNLYYYNYESFRQQIDESDINENTASALLECVLKMIKVFDYCEDHHFLDMAENLLERISVWIEKPLSILNEFQIKKRKCGLSASDLKEIAEIDDNSDQIQFGKSVLLGDKKSAELYFDRFTLEMKDLYKTFPIYKLFLDLQ